MNYSQKSKLKKYLSKTIWVMLFAFNCCILLYMLSHICKIWTNQNFDLMKTFLIFDQEEEFKNLVSAKHQLWTALVSETALLVLGGFFTYDFLIRVKNFRLNIIASFVLFFCIFTGESLLLFFPAPDKALEIQTCESIPLKNCSPKEKNCTPKYITWNKENHYCNLIELERQRMMNFLEQKAVEKRQALLAQKKFIKEQAKLLEKRKATLTKENTEKSKIEKKSSILTEKDAIDNIEQNKVPSPVFSDDIDTSALPENDSISTEQSPVLQEQQLEKNVETISESIQEPVKTNVQQKTDAPSVQPGQTEEVPAEKTN